MKTPIKLIFSLALAFLATFAAPAQTTITSGGRIVRGSGTNMASETFLIGLDGQQGVLTGPALTNLYNHITTGNVTNIYHLNITNTLSQNIPTNRYRITNALAAYGTKNGAPPLYYGQTYHFAAYGGQTPSGDESVSLVITLVNRSDRSYNTTYYFDVPTPSASADWQTFMSNGATRIYQVPGMTTSC